jgi:hypothetical protein
MIEQLFPRKKYFTFLSNWFPTTKTTIDKYVTNSNKGKLYCCFVNFQKAFDSIWHEGLFRKLLKNKIGGNIYDLIAAG